MVPAWSRGDTRALTALAAGALLLRVAGLTAADLWIDEVYSLRDAEAPTVNARLRPLYYLLLRGWQLLVGDDVGRLRLPSAVLGAAAVALLYGLVRRVASRRAAALAAGALALAASELSRAQEIRMYALGTALALAVAWALWRWHERPDPRRLAAVVGLLAAATAATPTTLLATAPALAVALAAARRSGRGRAALVGALVALALAAAPYAWRHRAALPAMQGAASRAAPPSAASLLAWPARQLVTFPGLPARQPGYRALGALLGATLLGLGVLAATTGPPPARAAARALAAWLAVAAAGCFAYSRVAPPFWEVRYFHALTPLLAALAGLGADAALRRRRRAGVAAATVLLAILGADALAFHSQARSRGQWRALAQWALALARPGDAVILQGNEQVRAWRYYGGGALPTYTLASLGIASEKVTVATLLAAAPPEHRRLFLVLEPARLEGRAPRRLARRQLAAAGRVLGRLSVMSLEIVLLDRDAPPRPEGDARGGAAAGQALALPRTRETVIRTTPPTITAAASRVRGASGSPANAQPSSMATTGLT